jgi:hypothetical protein
MCPCEIDLQTKNNMIQESKKEMETMQTDRAEEEEEVRS